MAQTRTIQLISIDVDPSKNIRFVPNPHCMEILKVYPEYYKKVGYNQPWIGYFVTEDGIEIIGACGYKGKPKDGKIEIAYGTFKKYEGKGIGSEMCLQLVLLSLKTNPSIRIMARTLEDNYKSIKVLKKNRFECIGKVQDEDDGEVLEWEYKSITVTNDLNQLQNNPASKKCKVP